MKWHRMLLIVNVISLTLAWTLLCRVVVSKLKHVAVYIISVTVVILILIDKACVSSYLW